MGNSLTSDRLSTWEIKNLKQTTHFKESEIKELYEHFNEITNHDNLMTRKQFTEGIVKFGASSYDESVLNSLFDSFDTTNEGKINFKELIVGLAIYMNHSLSEIMKTIFDFFDLEGNHYISRREMSTVLKSLDTSLKGTLKEFHEQNDKSTKDEINEFVEKVFTEYDSENNNRLDFSEFCSAMNNHPFIKAAAKECVSELGENYFDLHTV